MAPQQGYDEPGILSYAIRPFCPTRADGLQAEANIAEEAGEELTIDRKLRDEAAMLADSRLADDPWDQTPVMACDCAWEV